MDLGVNALNPLSLLTSVAMLVWVGIIHMNKILQDHTPPFSSLYTMLTFIYEMHILQFMSAEGH